MMEWADFGALLESYRVRYVNNEITFRTFYNFLVRNGYNPIEATAEIYFVSSQADWPGLRVSVSRNPELIGVYS